jgi:hypothetical protein
MDRKTEIKVQLICDTCGDTDNFESNADKSHIKCNTCDREYHGGYDELVEYNQQRIKEIAYSEVKNILDEKFTKIANDFNQKSEFVKLKYKK